MKTMTSSPNSPRHYNFKDSSSLTKSKMKGLVNPNYRGDQGNVEHIRNSQNVSKSFKSTSRSVTPSKRGIDNPYYWKKFNLNQSNINYKFD